MTGLLVPCIADLSLQEIAAALGGEVSGLQVTAPGPNHTPKDRSLSVKLDANAPGGFVVHSFAGDDPIVCKDYVREKCGLQPFKSNGKPNGQSVLVVSHPYVDENGETLFVVDRYEPKRFRQRKPDGKGGWLSKLGDVRRVPDRLPKMIEAVACELPIFIAEGEKAIEALEKIGITATCSPGGAGKWRKEYSDHLKGANVVILPDADEPGEQHAISVAASLGGVAKKVRVSSPSQSSRQGGSFDWIANAGTADALWKLVEATPEYTGSDAKHGALKGRSLVTRCAADIQPEPIEWIWPGRIARGKHTAIAGEPGVAKSQLLLDFIATLTKGGLWPHGEGQAPCGRVILLSAEDGAADTIVPRLMAAKADRSLVEIIHAVQNEGGKGQHTFNLQTDLDLLEDEIKKFGDVDLVAIDPISSYFGKGPDSHKNVDVRGVLEPVSEMAERLRVAVLSITHFSKPGTGTASKALHKFIGSIAFVAAPRIAFVVMEDPEDQTAGFFCMPKTISH